MIQKEILPETAKPKISILSKLKKSLKLYSNEDKRAMNIPQLARPPSTYIGSEQSLNASDQNFHIVDRTSEQSFLVADRTSEQSLHIADRTSEQSFHVAERGQTAVARTPTIDLRNIQDSKNSIHRLDGPSVEPPVEPPAESPHNIRNVASDLDITESAPNSRSRSCKRADKRKGRSRSLSKFLGNVARKAKSLTEVRRPQSPPWYGNNTDPVREPVQNPQPYNPQPYNQKPYNPQLHSPQLYSQQPHSTQLHRQQPHSSQPYSPQTHRPQLYSPQHHSPQHHSPQPHSPHPITRHPEQGSNDPGKCPERKRRSFVGKIKRKLSIGKGDKIGNVERTKEFSKSSPVLAQPPSSPAPVPKQINRAKSSENVSTTSSLTSSTNVRTQIVLKSAKINKGCKCQVCSLVRRNIRSHCDSRDPTSHHKYEVVLKMNLLGADFLNSDCGSVASYQGPEEESEGEQSDRQTHDHQTHDHQAHVHQTHDHQTHDHQTHDHQTHEHQTGGDIEDMEQIHCWNETQSVASTNSQDSTSYETLRHALSQARISVV